LRADFPSTKRYPFLIGDREAVGAIRDYMAFNDREPPLIIAEAQRLDPAAWFASQESEARREGFDEAELLGQWAGRSPEKGTISLHRDVLTGAIKPVVYIGLAELDEPWMLPAVTGYGGWNECPEAAVHCAVVRYWGGRYGAEIVGLASDTIECLVKNPPATQEAAIQLAWEQYWYCRDIVDQGTETVADLAAGLLNSDYWYFWWD
jgi:hypothetical protein